MNYLFNSFLLSALSWDEIYPNLMKSLNILWQGLLAILIVVGIIILVTCVMQNISEKARAKKEQKNAESESENDKQ